MKSTVLLAAVLGLGLATSATAQQEPNANMQIVAEKIRADKKLLVASNMDLTEAEAAKFWPVYDAYQVELGKLADRTITMIKGYAATYQTMTDEAADKLLTELMAIEKDRLAVMNKFRPQFRCHRVGAEGGPLLPDREQDPGGGQLRACRRDPPGSLNQGRAEGGLDGAGRDAGPVVLGGVLVQRQGAGGGASCCACTFGSFPARRPASAESRGRARWCRSRSTMNLPMTAGQGSEGQTQRVGSMNAAFPERAAAAATPTHSLLTASLTGVAQSSWLSRCSLRHSGTSKFDRGVSAITTACGQARVLIRAIILASPASHSANSTMPVMGVPSGLTVVTTRLLARSTIAGRSAAIRARLFVRHSPHSVLIRVIARDPAARPPSRLAPCAQVSRPA